jgi:hypothetical protein
MFGLSKKCPPARNGDIDSCSQGGSIAWEQAHAEISKDDPFLASFIAAHFDVAPAGAALLARSDPWGKSLVRGYKVGDRLAPYDFNAKPKGAAGEYNLHLSFEPLSFDGGETTTWEVTMRKKLESE